MPELRSFDAFREIRISLLLVAAATLAGCGGSGGNDDPPPSQATVTLTANPTSITAGQISTLTWSSTNATGCTASQGWTGTKATSGSEQTGPLSANTTFTLTCGAASQSVTVTVTSPQPTVTLTANPTVVAAGQFSTLTWASTDATSCTASEGWSGAKATSGTEQVGPVNAATAFTLTCTGSGGSASQSATVTPVAAGNVIVSGRIEFERVNFRTAAGQGLDIGNPVIAPARQVVVEAVDPGTRLRIGSAVTTATDGSYSLEVPQNTNMLISARAEMLKTGAAPTWNFRVLNNTNSSALYVLDSSAFDSGTAGSTRNLRATTGWGGTSYTGQRAAAPFAILDTAYAAKERILSARPSEAFPALDLHWSPDNKPTVGTFCTTSGDIGTTFYSPGAANAGNCTANGTLPGGIYVLGDFIQSDTDEFDQHVIAHEFGHYVEDQFSRSDSIGGLHGSGDRLDLRVAFGEGWGNAYSGMVLNDPAYRDSSNGVSADGGFNLETNSTTAEGWYSEFSVGEILWDLFDSVDDAGDQISLGFAPIYSVLTGSQRTTDALTSIFPFAQALRSANSGQTSAINALLARELVSVSDAFGDSESNAGGSSTALPIYQDPASQMIVCSSGGDDSRNKLGYRRFLRLNVTSASAVTITATGAVDPTNTASVAATDPDIYVYRRGAVVAFSEATGSSETIAQRPLAAGLHIIEVYDFDLGAAPRCMSVSISGI